MNLENQIKDLDCYTHQDIISKIENETNLNSFEAIIEITQNSTRHNERILLPSTVTRFSTYCWNFECSKNGLIQKVYVNSDIFISQEDLKNECELNSLENQSNEC
jgi:hypothetical protein